MPSRRDIKLRHARYYCALAERCQASDNKDIYNNEIMNIRIGIETAEEYKDYALLARYVKSISENWVGKEWNQYKHYVSLVLTTSNVDAVIRIRYLANLANIEELQGNSGDARRYLEEEFNYLTTMQDKDNHNDLYKMAMQLLRLARVQNNFDNLESVLLYAYNSSIRHDDIKQQVDVLLELACLPEVQSNFQKANEYIDLGLNIANSNGYKIGVIDTLITKGSICEFHKRLPEALHSYRDARDLAESINDIRRANEIKKELQKLEGFMGRKIFISYTHADRAFAEKLARDLRDAGLSVWWDEWEIKVGNSIYKKVNDGINSSAYLIVVLSPSSVKAPWVEQEVGSVLMIQLSKEKDITILPVWFKDCEIPPLLRGTRAADFRNEYDLGLAEIINTLK